MVKNSTPDYQAALDYIYSFVDFSRTHQENLSPDNFDLSRMRAFMGLLGSPQDDYPSIHIAGSKGKGSVSAFCASALQKGGFKVGLYTSPHLKDFEERIQIDQEPLPRPALVKYVAEIKEAVASVPELTTFEIMTGLGFLHFSREKVDIAVIEVGLGGRLDATNVITPLVSVITSLYLDHVSILGDTLAKIAAEKGGIIKPGIPVISAPQEAEAQQVIAAIARKNGSKLIEVDREFPYRILSRTLDGQLEKDASQQDGIFCIPLLGGFQVINALTAYGALLEIRENGFPVDPAVIMKGFSETVWPGRFEVLRRSPPVVVDSAHNPASMGKLRDTIDEFFPDQDLILIFGISEDKQLSGMLSEILPRTSHLICTRADHPRAMDPWKLADQARAYGVKTEAISDVGQALSKALSLVDGNQVIVAAGSIFVAASARIAWFEDQVSNS
jgi:dihydrofolate synthase/folylpolyglutamate synthase